MRNRRRNTEHESHDRWLISYADFITLLFAFFVVMYAISSVNQKKYSQLTSSLGIAFGTKINAPPPKIGNQTPANQIENNSEYIKGKPLIIAPIAVNRIKNEQQKIAREKMNAMAARLNTALTTMVKNGKIKILQSSKGIRIDIYDRLLFSPGSAQLASVEALNTLYAITPMLLDNDLTIQIEGHTDNVPISNIFFSSNWELSAIRATSVLEVFSRGGVDDKRLSATGFGSSRPLASNATTEGKAANRRVSIMILKDNPE